MRSYLMETAQHVDFLPRSMRRNKALRSNPVLDWMSQHVVYDPGAKSVVGTCKSAQGSNNFYQNWQQWLYASYAEFCRSCNVGFGGTWSVVEVLFFEYL